MKGLNGILFFTAVLFFFNHTSSQTNPNQRKYSHGFIFNTSFSFGYKESVQEYICKTCGWEYNRYRHEREPFLFRTPLLGLGYYLGGRKRIIRADVGYRYGLKKINKGYSGNGDQLNGQSMDEAINGILFYYNPTNYIGKTIFFYNDSLSVNLNYHMIDWSLAYNRKIYRNLSFYFGFRSFKVFRYNYSGTLYRTAEERVITGNHPTGAGSWRDSLVAVHEKTYSAKNLNSLIGQSIDGATYLSFGLTYNYFWCDKHVIIDLIHDFYLFRPSAKYQNNITIKASYLFK
jgi:hypothetical protein